MPRIAQLIVMLMALPSLHNAYAQVVPFDSVRWEIRARQSQFVEYLNQPSLLMKGGVAVVKDSDFKNGVIEFDIAFAGERGFMGALWRMVDSNNFEEFYLRPHQSGNPDANQYTPIFNGSSGWQLYHGEGYGAPVEYVFNEWMHVKIVVSGSRGEVYIRDMETPAVVIQEMKHGVASGRIGLMCANFASAYFANFKYTPVETLPLDSPVKYQQPAPAGTITAWAVSNPLDEKSLAGTFKLTSVEKEQLTWTELKSETTGITNLARVHGPRQTLNTVFAKVTIESDKEQVKKMKFGYSDRIKVYFNNRLIYGGSNGYQSRDYRYLGTIGYFDELYLPLRRGSNELWLAVSEDFGGWGIQAMFEDTSEIEFKTTLVNK